jgi:carboxymethylenebutenolidase
VKHQFETQELKISLSESNEQFDIYIARPAGAGNFPLLIVGMEIFGVNDHIRGICNDLARYGFIVAAPDYYSRIAPGTALSYTPEEREKGLGYMNQLNREEVLQQTSATVDYLRTVPYNSGSLGFVGFSVGGHIGFYCASKLPFKLIVCYYAGWLTNTDILLSRPTPTMHESAGIASQGARMIFIKGEHDQLIRPVEDAELDEALTRAGVKHELIIYPRTGHGFFCEERPASFSREARDLSWKVVLSAIAEL